MLYYPIIISMVLFLGAPLLLCNWLVHSIALFFALVKIHRLSSYPLFWVLLACAYFCSTEARFSVENYLICSGFLAWALDRQWLTAAIKKRNLALIIIFVVSFLLDIFDKSILERGSLGLLLPGFLFLNISNQRNLMIILSLKALLSNKASTIIALVFTYIYRYSKKLSLFCFLAAAGTLFLFKNHFEQFWSKSIISRLYIWSSSFQGFSLKPLLGHGFGTFALDMPLNRIISDTWGSRADQQISHGHSLIAHIAFEQGIIGLIVLVVLFWMIFKYARAAFLPLLIVSICDSSLANPSQYLLWGLLFAPLLIKQIPKINLVLGILSSLFALSCFVPSALGHYYYDQGNYDKAIKYDSRNGLYYLTRGAYLLETDTKAAQKDFEQAIKYNPNIGYFYGFLAASQLANHQFTQSINNIDTAIKYSGDNGYWFAIRAFDKLALGKDSRIDFEKAIELEPDLPELLKNPNMTANISLGSKNRDSRIVSFWRRGPKLYLPLPYIPSKH